jgi:hypothetical protein
MKTITLPLTCFLFLYFNSSSIAQVDGGCGCHSSVRVYNYGLQEAYYNLSLGTTGPVTEYINPGDSISFHTSSVHNCYTLINLSCNGDTIFHGAGGGAGDEYAATVTDTGRYVFYSFCDALVRQITLDIQYFLGAGMEEGKGQLQEVFIYPSVTSGRCHILSGTNQLLNLLITDQTGRIVMTDQVIKEFDISLFTRGIYFYSLADQKKNVFRGRIVKE